MLSTGRQGSASHLRPDHSRASVGVTKMAIKPPVGPVAAFTPWNFPINQVVRKLSAALGAGCSIIVKAPDETPASPAELIHAFSDAGVPAGVVNIVMACRRKSPNIDPTPGNPRKFPS